MAITDATILEQNPWWGNPRSIETDHYLMALRDAPFRWRPPFLDSLSPVVGSVDTLRGPRQVGKSTACKTLIANLVAAGERRILYYAFDLAGEAADLPEVIRAAQRLHPDPSGPWYVVFDEVTTVPDWQRGIKYAVDSALAQDSYILCTGSSAHRMGSEQLSGRRGAGQDYLLLPLSFRDYCEAVRGIHLSDPIPLGDLLSDQGRRALREIHLLKAPLQAAYGQYARTGGFPAAITDTIAQGHVSRTSLQLLWSMIATDLATIDRDPLAAVGALDRVMRSLGSSLSWQSLAKSMGVGSHNTAKDYALLLAEAYVLLVVYFWDPSTGAPNPSKQRKVYFQDPLFLQVVGLLGHESPSVSPAAMRENLVCQALFRSATDRLVQAEAAPGAVAFWNSSRAEIDFNVRTSTGRVAVEVKSDGASGIRRARRAIGRVFGQGLVVTDTVFEPDETIPTVPACVFLAALADQPIRQPLVI